MTGRPQVSSASEHAPCASEDMRTGLAEALMREIAGLLEDLASSGAEGAIDLRSLPMTDADRADLEARLGRGEIAAEIDVAGRTSVWETGYAGVWWLRHFDGEDRVVTEYILITRIPEILMSHPDDVRAAADRLAGDLTKPKDEQPHNAP